MSTQELKSLSDDLAKKIIYTTKEVLTSDEASLYLGISKSHLYKLTMRRVIPHYKPMGKMCYFNRGELEQWLLTNRVSTDSEINARAQAICMKGGKA